AVNVPGDAAFAALTLSGGASLSIAYTGVSPIGSWNGSVYTDLSGMVQSGHISTSSASGLTAIGVAEVSGHVLVKQTYAGDANLDGKIDISDYGRIDFNIGLHTTGWANGDFNYDGKIDISDYGII